MRRAGITVGLLALMVLPAALAQPNAAYDIPSYTIDNGGGVTQGGAYTLLGTIGQSAAGYTKPTNTDLYRLLSGFITEGVASPTAIRVVSFTATGSVHTVTLRWRAAAEVGALGYNVYGQLGKARIKLNKRLIAARKGVRGATYSFAYGQPRGGSLVRFWLQALPVRGTPSWYGPARVRYR
jgi:hypothetical protein